MSLKLPDPEEQPLLESSEVAELMRRSVGTVNRAIRAGEIPSVTIGGRRYVPTAKLRDLLGIAS